MMWNRAPNVTNVLHILRKKDDRVDWLYSGPAASVNREEYLLGKKIDKAIDPTLVEEEREKEVTKRITLVDSLKSMYF